MFNPACDLHEVDQFGFLNLRDVYENGAVDGAMSFEAEKYNGVSDPSVLLSRPKDQFEALRQSDYVRDILRTEKEKKSASAASDTNVKDAAPAANE